MPKRVTLPRSKEPISSRLEEDRFESAQVGDEFVVLLTRKGEVYSFGENIDNQLGCASEQAGFRLEPEKVGGVPLLKSVHVGRNHCFGVNVNHELYGWGSNKYSQVGVSDTLPMVMKPQAVGVILPTNYRILASSYCTLLLCSDKPILNSPQNPFKDSPPEQ